MRLIVYKKIKIVLIFNFLFPLLRGNLDKINIMICNQLIYIVLIWVIFTPYKLLNFSAIFEAAFFLVENSM